MGAGTLTGNAQREGDRPALTPKHSASLWTTYMVMPKLRIGGGLNYRGKQNPEGARHVTADSLVTFDAMADGPEAIDETDEDNPNQQATEVREVGSVVRGATTGARHGPGV